MRGSQCLRHIVQIFGTSNRSARQFQNRGPRAAASGARPRLRVHPGTIAAATAREPQVMTSGNGSPACNRTRASVASYQFP